MLWKRQSAGRPRADDAIVISPKNGSIRWVAACLLVAATSIPSGVLHADVDEEARKSLREIAQLVDHPPDDAVSGTGEAVVTEDTDGKKSDQYIAFRFKENMSRSDTFDYTGGQKGKLQVIYAVNQKNSVSYNGYNAMIQASPPGAFHRTIRRDFHPETYTSVFDNRLTVLLTSMAERAPNLRLSLDPNGILRIENHMDSATERGYVHFSLDTTKGYRLTAWEMHSERKDNERIVSTLDEGRTYQWERTGSVWYVKEFHLHSTKTKKPGATPKTSRYEAKVVVNNFVPNIAIEDSDFTLQGLHVPYGTIINDNIVGVDYKYGSGVRGTQRLEAPLREAEFVRIINSQPDGNAISAGTGGGDGNRGSLLAEGESKTCPHAIRICLLFGAATCMGALLLASIVRRRAKGKGGLLESRID